MFFLVVLYKVEQAKVPVAVTRVLSTLPVGCVAMELPFQGQSGAAFPLPNAAGGARW